MIDSKGTKSSCMAVENVSSNPIPFYYYFKEWSNSLTPLLFLNDFLSDEMDCVSNIIVWDL